MKKVAVQDAVGQTLCHDMTAIMENGFKGVKFKRGQILNIGKDHIFIWDPEADEVHEDDAAMALTDVMCGENLTVSGPSEGKMQINAACDGLFVLNREGLLAINYGIFEKYKAAHQDEIDLYNNSKWVLKDKFGVTKLSISAWQEEQKALRRRRHNRQRGLLRPHTGCL